MASQLSNQSVVEICAFVPRSKYNKYKSLPNSEWRAAAEHCVVPERGNLGDVLPAEYLSSDDFRISAGKYTLREALDVVFSRGEPILLVKAPPKGFIECILERYGRACKEWLVMRNVHIKIEEHSSEQTDFTDFWINAYYTSFPCRHCTGYDNAEEYHEVFHLTPPDASQCLSLKYTPYKRIEVISCRPNCHVICVTRPEFHQERHVLRSTDLLYQAFRVLPRVDLDTCLLVNKLWGAEVNELSPELALRELKCLNFTYNPDTKSMCFMIRIDRLGYGGLREFTMPRNATVDSAVALNHLRNCTTATNSFVFDVFRRDYEEENVKLDYSVRLWITNLLGSMKACNFHFNGLCLRVGRVNPAQAVDFLFTSSIALHSCAKYNGLRKISLGFNYKALAGLVDQGFLQLPYVQKLKEIKLAIWVFGPDFPDDHSWIRGLFQLLNGKKILVEYTPRGPSKPDCSEHVFGVLLRTVKYFENTIDVSGFPDDFEFVLEQDELTWDHQESTPTYSNVPVPMLDGLWNIYVTKNIATGVPLSVFVSAKENCQEDGDDYEPPLLRRFIFRKELYVYEPVKTSRPSKRHLQ